MFLSKNLFLLLLAPALVFTAPLTADLQDRSCNGTCIDDSQLTPARGHRPENLSKRSGPPSLWYDYWQTTDICKDDLGGHRCLTSACGQMQVLHLDGDGFTPNGPVQISITRKSDFGVIWGGTLTTHLQGGFRDGAFGVQTNVLDCTTEPGRFAPTAAYMAAWDVTTKTWSNGIDIEVGCIWDIQIHGASY